MLKNLKITVIALLLAGFSLSSFAAKERAAPKHSGDDQTKKPSARREMDEAYEAMTMLVTVMRLLQKYYVDEDKVSSKKLIKGALKGMLHELDPYSAYEIPAVYKRTSDKFFGKIVGIGVLVVKSRKGGLKVINPIPGSPAMKAGIKPGDIITSVNGKNFNGMSLSQAVALIKGKAGTPVTLKVIRQNSDKELTFKVKRAIVKRSPIPYNGVRVLSGDIGYIRLNLFSIQTASALDLALAKLKKKKVKAIILDLRNNPGGLLKAAIDVCSRFLAQGEPIISTEGRDSDSRSSFFAVDSPKYLDIPLLVMINRYSASASEIVAGCLRDNKRAILLGSRSFGKASVQRVKKLPNNGAIRFTIAKYYTPSRKLIHGKGIEPDINLQLPLHTRLKLAAQIAHFPGQVHPKGAQAITDTQLQKAIQTLQKIIKDKKRKAGDKEP